jgi:hypothetical protein
VARRLWLAVGMLAVLLVACSADDEPARNAAAAAAPNPSAPRAGPLTPTDPDRITPAQREAIRRLAASTAPGAADSTHDHGHGRGHGQSGPATTVVLDAADRATFEAQWDAAAAAVPALDTAAERAAAGYVRAAVQGAGIGVHWVDWTLIEAPFDPARPAMLLVDERAGRDDLVGFSYWVRSPDPPAGFAGVNDVWHRHSNLCIVNGWVDREQVTSTDACAGDLLAGADLWMLHAWVVPDVANRWGDFAVRHPALCPPAMAVPDIARCPDG